MNVLLFSLVLMSCMPISRAVQLYPQDCYPNGTVVVQNPNPSVLVSVFAVLNEGTSVAQVCEARMEGVNVIVTGCPLNGEINIFMSDRPVADNITFDGGIDGGKFVSYCVFCSEIPDGGLNATVYNILGATIEVTTQDAITPSFTVTSALRTGSETGSEVSSAMVGDTVYWNIDIPAEYKGRPTCTAYSGTDSSGSPTKLLVDAGCREDDSLLGDDFDNEDTSVPTIKRIWTTLYVFKFYNADNIYFVCEVKLCPSSSSSCDISCNGGKKRSASLMGRRTTDVKREGQDEVFTTGRLLHIMPEIENVGAINIGNLLLLTVASLVTVMKW